jgi:uncharacterized phiE125 gp8 family phage protein
MELFLKSPPTQEPVTLEEVHAYLRLSSDREDELLKTFIATARAHVEHTTGRALLKQKWQMTVKPPYPRSSPLIKCWESELIIVLPKPPLLAIQAVKAKGKSIAFRREENKIILSPRFREEEIRIAYWAGYGETPLLLPPDLKMAVLEGVRCLYEHQPLDLPLLTPFKVFHL